MNKSFVYPISGAIILILVLLGVYAYSRTHKETAPEVTTTTQYLCRGGKAIDAQYSPERVILTLSDTRAFVLPQAQSASGVRYEKEGVIFVSEGDNAFLQENGTETYVDCVATGSPASSAVGDRKQFVDAAGSFSFTYPNTVTVSGGDVGYTEAWMNNGIGTGLVLAKTVMGAPPGPKTNFSEATLGVGTGATPSAVEKCLTHNPGGAGAGVRKTINGTTYSVLQSNDAGAGNQYETTSYRTVRDNQCYVIEYTIHSTNIGNYPPGEVTEFDRAAVVQVMEDIVGSFRFTAGSGS